MIRKLNRKSNHSFFLKNLCNRCDLSHWFLYPYQLIQICLKLKMMYPRIVGLLTGKMDLHLGVLWITRCIKRSIAMVHIHPLLVDPRNAPFFVRSMGSNWIKVKTSGISDPLITLTDRKLWFTLTLIPLSFWKISFLMIYQEDWMGENNGDCKRKEWKSWRIKVAIFPVLLIAFLPIRIVFDYELQKDQ